MDTEKDRHSVAVDGLRQILGAGQVSTDDATRTLFATDVFRTLETPVAVIHPDTQEQLAAAIACATRHGLAVVPRGGGMSYTGGYLSERAGSVVVDTRRLNRIVEVNREDLYVTVECGVTWAQLDEALKDTGLRPPFWGTGSGLFATVGGSLSQNAMNYGSARHGTSADSVLSLTVALADGTLLRTGSAGTVQNGSPFFRAYGPDVTGLFLGDTGALGIKTQATLRLLPRPPASGFVSFEFADQSGYVAALTALARESVASQIFGFDPRFLRQRIKRQGIVRDLQLLKGVALSGRSLLAGLRDAAKVAMAGRRFLADAAYTVHVTVEGRDEDELRSALNAVRRATQAVPGMREIEPSVPRLSHGTPFPQPNLLVNDDTEVWVPVHALVPPSRLDSMLTKINGYFDSVKAVIDEHDIDWGCVCSVCGPHAMLVEPSFYYRDALNPLHRHVLGDTLLKGIQGLPPNPDTKAAVARIRQDLADLFLREGTAHLQIGKFYHYRESRQPELLRLLEAIKASVDPQGLINPGSLGLR